MTRLGRYWLFFVIVAVGLALSWGQVGRKAQRVLEAQPVSYLAVETRCYADREPCAAVTVDHALVLGPAGADLRLEQTGFEGEDIAALEAALLRGPDLEPVLLSVRRTARGWRIELVPGEVGAVRIRMAAAGRVSVADFPLSNAVTEVQ
jgi:hypothetical protein